MKIAIKVVNTILAIYFLDDLPWIIHGLFEIKQHIIHLILLVSWQPTLHHNFHKNGDTQYNLLPFDGSFILFYC